MVERSERVCDGNEAAAMVAYRLSEAIAIYPITPASPMGELSDEWASHQRPNLWGQVPSVTEMQSEAGAAGCVHGALQAGALSCTFTASQGLLLMLPNMFKIAGELTPFCLHVAARSVATHALSIFGDHSDVMACRGTGFALLASASVQQAHDFACIAHAVTLAARVPFLHFFDGFRTSHELVKIALLDDRVLSEMIDADALRAHRARALNPDRPHIRGTAQNPDTFFQAREACNPYYDACAELVAQAMRKFATLTGRSYAPFDYVGHPEAESVVVSMGSGSETVAETVRARVAQGERIGAVAVRLYRPFDGRRFVSVLPASVRRVAVLDRTKEPGAPAEPLYLDVVCALDEHARGRDINASAGRYGLSSKEFTPAQVAAVFAELASEAPRKHFTVGIVDDVTRLSLKTSEALDVLPASTRQAVFYGLGADGTVSANKSTLKIVGKKTALWPQGYFVYDSKKSGSMTVSHLRFATEPVNAPYLIEGADFVAVHQFEFFEKLDVLRTCRRGATLLLNAPYQGRALWDALPRETQQQIVDKELRVHAVDAYRVAREAGLGGRINTVMQVCFFALAKLLPMDEALAEIKASLEQSYGKKGVEVVRRNLAAVDAALHGLHALEIPNAATASARRAPIVASSAPDFVQRVTAVMLAGDGDLLPVSAFPPDGTWPSGTSRWEKRNIALEIPVWDEALCIQCNKCTLTCPHAAIRAKVYDPAALRDAPHDFKSSEFRSNELTGKAYTIQVAPEDCTGCQLCVEVCPARDKQNPRHKALEMQPQRPLREAERTRFDFFLSLPEANRSELKRDVKHLQLMQPLFEYSGACSGCGETPYIKLLTQMFGDRLLIANATGCSSIYGGNLPTTPYATNAEGRGPAWANSLFEDNAEFGLGMRLGVDALAARARSLLMERASDLPEALVSGLLAPCDASEAALAAQRARVLELRRLLAQTSAPSAALSDLADYLVPKSVWLVGGDGWAYDIGFGGLDHVLASGANVNILVLDTEVYSNTGGQQSKATPLGAAAKFAASGKSLPKKDLGLIAMAYDHVYVAQVALGAKDNQTVSALLEAEQYEGPSLVIAYSHCIAHGYDLRLGLNQQKLAVESGVWPLFRYDPRRVLQGESPLHLDSGPAKRPVREYMRNEARFRMVEALDPKRFRWLEEEAQRHASRRVEHYRQLAALRVSKEPAESKET